MHINAIHTTNLIKVSWVQTRRENISCLKLWQNFRKWLVPRPCTAPFTLESAGYCNVSSVSVCQIIQRVQLIRLARRVWRTYILHIKCISSERDFIAI